MAFRVARSLEANMKTNTRLERQRNVRIRHIFLIHDGLLKRNIRFWEYGRVATPVDLCTPTGELFHKILFSWSIVDFMFGTGCKMTFVFLSQDSGWLIVVTRHSCTLEKQVIRESIRNPLSSEAFLPPFPVVRKKNEMWKSLWLSFNSFILWRRLPLCENCQFLSLQNEAKKWRKSRQCQKLTQRFFFPLFPRPLWHFMQKWELVNFSSSGIFCLLVSPGNFFSVLKFDTLYFFRNLSYYYSGDTWNFFPRTC